jgi:outer membrane protein TolC
MTRVFLILILSVSAQAQMTLSQAVDSAIRNYPSVRVSQEQINAAGAGIQLARTAYLPKVDALAQINRATRNNVFGMLLPQSVIPSMSGPVIGSNNFGTAWGSAMGVLVTWEPFDFGLRKASVDASAAARAASEAAFKKTEFEVSVAAADAYVTLVAAQETVRAAQAGVDRAEAISRTIHAQVNAELRPGADASRVDAEVAASRTLMIQAQQAVEIARVTVSQFVGLPPAGIAVTSAQLLRLPPEGIVAQLDTGANPVAMEQNAVIEQLRAQLKVLERSYFPHFYAQASTYARGTGAEINGNNLGGVNGLAPTVQNSAVGFSVTFSVFDRPAIRAKEAGQSATIRQRRLVTSRSRRT